MLEKHLIAPCEVAVEGAVHTIRSFYIRELEKFIPKITDDQQRTRAEHLLRQYKTP